MAVVGHLSIMLSASVTDFERTMGAAVRAVRTTELELRRSARRMDRIGRDWAVNLSLPILAAVGLVSKAFISWEDQFAGVRKAVRATETEFKSLEAQLLRLGETDLPLSYKDIAVMAEMGGQFGLATGSITEFVRTVGRLSEISQDLTPMATAQMIAQMDNMLDLTQLEFDRMGSAIAGVAGNMALTEGQLVQFVSRVGGTMKNMNLSIGSLFGIAGAFTQVGVEARVGATAVSKVLSSMNDAVVTGSDKLEIFARTAGMTADEFSKAWATKPEAAFVRFIEGLGQAGAMTTVIYNKLGLQDTRLRNAFTNVAASGDKLRKAVDLGNKSWAENVELTRRAEIRFASTGKRLVRMRNYLTHTAIIFGEGFNPAIQSLLDMVDRLNNRLRLMAERFNQLDPRARKLLGTVLGLVVAFGALFTAIAAVIKIKAVFAATTLVFTELIATVTFAVAAVVGGAATIAEALALIAGGISLKISAIIAFLYVLIFHADKVSRVFLGLGMVLTAALTFIVAAVAGAVAAILTLVSLLVPALWGVADRLFDLSTEYFYVTKMTLRMAFGLDAITQSAEDTEEAVDKAAQSHRTLADAITQVSEAMQKNLQSFDEVHTIQDDVDFSYLFDNIDFAGDDWRDMFPDFDSASDAVRQMGEMLSNAPSGDLSFFESIEAANTALAESIQSNWQSTTTFLTTAWTGLERMAGDTWTSIATSVEGAKERIYDSVNNTWMTLESFLVGTWGRLKGNSVADDMAQKVTAANKNIWDDTFYTWQPLGVFVGGTLDSMKQKTATTWEEMVADVAEAQAAVDGSLVRIGMAWGEFRPAGKWDWVFDYLDSVDQDATFDPTFERLSHEWATFSPRGRWGWVGQYMAGIDQETSLRPTLARLDAAWSGFAPSGPWAWGGDMLESVETDLSGRLGTMLTTTDVTLHNFAPTPWSWGKQVWEPVEVDTSAALTNIDSKTATAWDTIKEVASTAWANIRAAVSGELAGMDTDLEPKLTALQTTFTGGLVGLVPIATDQLTGLNAAFESGWGAIGKTTSTAWDTLSTALGGTWTDIGTDAAELETSVSGSWDSLQISTKTNWDVIKATMFGTASESSAKAKAMKTNVTKAFADMDTDSVASTKHLTTESESKFDLFIKNTKKSVGGWAESMGGFFHGLYMRVVGGSIIPDMVDESLEQFEKLKDGSIKEVNTLVSEVGKAFNTGFVELVVNTKEKGEEVRTLADNIGSAFRTSFLDAFDKIYTGALTLQGGLNSILSALGDVIKTHLSEKIKAGAASSLEALGKWATGVVNNVGVAVGALIKQAYATLLAFFAWSGPAAPALAAGVIGGAILGMGALAARALHSLRTEVPGLAKGGIVTSPTMAMIGEGGRSEAVIPLERDNVIADSVGRAVYEAVTLAGRVASVAGTPQEDKEVVLRIDSTTLARAILPAIEREGHRQGFDLILHPRGV